MSASLATSIIYPPPELRTVVDITAHFVAKNGKEFERKLLETESSRLKFAFLLSDSPYHNYYNSKIEHFIANPNEEAERTRKLQPVAKSSSSASSLRQPTASSTTTSVPTGATTISKKSQVFITEKPVSDPYPFYYRVQLPKDKNLTPQELEIIQTAAQYTAKNGRQFYQALYNREQSNHQFDFLKPQHRLFPLFSKYVEIYQKIIDPPQAIIDDLLKLSLTSMDSSMSKESLNGDGVGPKITGKAKMLQMLYNKAEWEKMQSEMKRRETAEKEYEETGKDVNWYDFIVVETIDFTDEDYRKFQETNGSLQQHGLEEKERKEKELLLEKRQKEEADALEDMEIDMVNVFDERKGEVRAIVGGETVKIIKDYVKPTGTTNNTALKMQAVDKASVMQMVQDPITGKIIPIEEVNEHLRKHLIHPKYQEQKQKELEKFKTTNIARTDEMIRNVHSLKKQTTSSNKK